jgi:hypothetical protein
MNEIQKEMSSDEIEYIPKKKNETIPCKLCTDHFINKKELLLHYINIHKYKPLIENNLNNNQEKKIELSIQNITIMNNILKCVYCNKILSRIDNLKRHEETCKKKKEIHNKEFHKKEQQKQIIYKQEMQEKIMKLEEIHKKELQETIKKLEEIHKQELEKFKNNMINLIDHNNINKKVIEI